MLRLTHYNLLGEKIEHQSSTYENIDFQRVADRKNTIMSRDSNNFMEKVGLDKNMLQDKISSDKKKKEVGIRSVYQIIVDKNKKKIFQRVVIFTLIISVLFTSALLTSVFLKQNNQNIYMQATHINSAYHKLMMVLTKDITFLKYANTISFQKNPAVAQMFFSSIDQ